MNKMLERKTETNSDISLVIVPLADLKELSQSRIPFETNVRMMSGALPPQFVAQRSLNQLAEGKSEEWCSTFYIYRKLDRTLVGSCGFKDAPIDGRVEIGYGISPECRNEGLATAAVEVLLDRAFKNNYVKEVLAQVCVVNHASTRIVQKLGFMECGSKIDKDNEVLVQWRTTKANWLRLRSLCQRQVLSSIGS